MKKYALSSLVLDFDVYPRGDVDSHHVSEIAAAIEAGASMPPLVIDKKSKRIADGFHRCRAFRRIYDEKYEVDCIEKEYKNDKELFLDSMRYNASHGRALTQHDKVHCLLLADRLKISSELIAQALNITSVRIGELRSSRIGTIGTSPVALKQTIRHMGGKTLTEDQGRANDKLSGMNQLFYVNQIITLIDNELIDMENADLMKGLAKLHGMLGKFVTRKGGVIDHIFTVGLALRSSAEQSIAERRIALRSIAPRREAQHSTVFYDRSRT